LSYLLLLVEGDDDDRKRVHAFKFCAKVGFFSYFCGLFARLYV
jgi:hypothetical protein